MPTSDGRYVLNDFVNELIALGFSGYANQDLVTYVNRGYYHVARKNRWYWEQTTDSFTLQPGSFSVPLWPTTAGELPNFRSLDRVYLTLPATSQVKLNPMHEEEFFRDWLSQDLSVAQVRGTPNKYRIHNGQLYILSPPQVPTTFLAHYHQRVSPLTNANAYPLTPPSDVPITPAHLDEAILIGAKIICHKRATEMSLAATEQMALDEFFDDMKDDDAELMDEEFTRVAPDDTWL